MHNAGEFARYTDDYADLDTRSCTARFPCELDQRLSPSYV